MSDIHKRTHTKYAHVNAPKSLTFFILLAFVLSICQVSAVIIDNDQIGTSSTGTWQLSGASDFYGSESLWSRNGGTYTWTADSLSAGLYDVQLWWTEWPSRSTAVPVEVTHADGTADLTVNQQIDGGQWNTVGQYYFDGAGSVTVFAPEAYPTSYCADAVQFLLVQAGQRPEAAIDSISPSPAGSSEIVTFTGSGIDDGSIVDSRWESNLDGVLGASIPANPNLSLALSDGVHTISFFVQDNSGLWSAAAVETLVVGTEPTEFIIDNGDAGTSSTGTWQPSGASSFYGDESLWSRNGATYTWSFTPPVAGNYEVFMWWTEWSSRSTAAPVQISHVGGPTDLTVNQQNNGGLWNSLGTYQFDGTGSVRISAPGAYPTSYCADAVRFTKVSDAYVIADFEASVTSGDAPLTVNFTDLSTSSAAIDSWAWDFDNNGTIDSTDQNPTFEYTVPGTYTVALTASGTDGSDAEVKTNYVVVTDPSGPTELIIDNGEPGTSSTGTWQSSGAAGFYGTDSLWSRNGATYTYSFNLSAGTYEVFLWWTEWSSRSTETPIRVTHGTGVTDTAVNQQVNGGQWNSLGYFYFDGAGSVRVSAPGSYPTSYCADAVRIVTINNDPLPVANIVSVSPNPAEIYDDVTFTGQGNDPAGGTITAYEWTSSLDGFLSGSASFVTDTLSEGVHNISFRVKNDSDVWSTAVNASVEVVNPSSNIERIYCCFGYYASDQRGQLTNYLNDIGTYQGNNVWHYVTPQKTYIITYVETPEDMAAALRIPGSHILYSGHSNYGLGPLFHNSIDEIRTQEINDVYYVDDPRILNISSDYVHVSVRGMRTGQSYPFWWPIYQDGTSALAPYTFGDPAGDPAYNYYISYQVPGDPTYYMVDTPRNPPVPRYWDTSVTPWFSSTGATPDPSNPAHHKYFVTNDGTEIESIISTGDWTQSKTGTDFFKENYWYSPAGSGESEVRFRIVNNQAGTYNVYAWWPGDDNGTTSATYRVYYAGGSDSITVDQSVSSGGWYLLGQYPFNVGYYSVRIDNNVPNGVVLADAIKLAHPDNPPDVVAADFYASTRVGPAPLIVSFRNQSIGDLTGRYWNFGDGFTNGTRDDIDHTYTKPGFYTVTLTASGPAGSDTITKTDYVWVTSSGEEPFQAEFRASSRTGSPPRTVYFRNNSTGNIAGYLWDFGDGNTSTQREPAHTYTSFGNYDVSLTITEAGTGSQKTLAKSNFVNVATYQSIDNVDYPMGHFSYYGKNIVRIREQDVPHDEIGAKRVFYYSCNSGNYYLDVFKHTGATVFYTLNLSDMTHGRAYFVYLYSYFNGYSDNRIWSTLQSKEPIFDYYDFSKRPDEQ